MSSEHPHPSTAADGRDLVVPGAQAASSEGSSSALTKVALAAAGAVAIIAVGWSGYKLAQYVSTSLERKKLVGQYQKQLILDVPQLKAIKQDILKQLDRGLREEIDTTGRDMLMLPTFVTQMPNGHETGDVYAIDLGGTNFRVMHVKLAGERSIVEGQHIHEVAIPKEVYTGPGTGLFDFLARELKGFLDKQHTGDSEPNVGFCFSFPTKQSGLDAGILLDWTKSFTCEGVVGEDPVRLLKEALARQGCRCRVVVLLNDAVAVLAAHRYLEPSTNIGVILGTGTNACYVEKLSRLTKWNPGLELPDDTETAINMEWGAFYSDLMPRCQEDDDLDKATAHPGRYLFEKAVSGMFLGEVARRILLRVAAQSCLLGNASKEPAAGQVLAKLASPNSFKTSDLARVVEDSSRMLTDVAAVLSESLGVSPQQAPFSSRQVVRDVCLIVAHRAAQLVAVAIDAVLTHRGWSAADGPTTIAFDGGMYEKFGAFRTMLQESLVQLRGSEDVRQLQMQLSHDGSCLGAAVLAAAAVAPAKAPAPKAAAAGASSSESSKAGASQGLGGGAPSGSAKLEAGKGPSTPSTPTHGEAPRREPPPPPSFAESKHKESAVPAARSPPPNMVTTTIAGGSFAGPNSGVDQAPFGRTSMNGVFGGASPSKPQDGLHTQEAAATANGRSPADSAPKRTSRDGQAASASPAKVPEVVSTSSADPSDTVTASVHVADGNGALHKGIEAARAHSAGTEEDDGGDSPDEAGQGGAVAAGGGAGGAGAGGVATAAAPAAVASAGPGSAKKKSSKKRGKGKR